jgi:hypothetical protein
MRPDRIVIGEVRGGEALDMMQAMNTGHDGSISTVHANSGRDALSRLETMMLMAGINLPERALREQISSAIDVIVQLTRLNDGSRKSSNCPKSPAWKATPSPLKRFLSSINAALRMARSSESSLPPASCRRLWIV